MKLILATILFGLTIGVAAQEPTIPEMVKRGEPVGGAVLIDRGNLYFEQLAQRGDLIVRGLILDANSHLTKDETSIVTDYSVQVFERLHARGTIKHGQTIVVTRPGGTVMVEGKKVTLTDSGFARFQLREEYIFFLKFNPNTQTYMIVAGPYGTFQNNGGEVEQVGHGTYKERGRVPLGLFVKELNDAINHNTEQEQGRGEGRGNNK